ncbi:hypothetical protein BDU57DRAFT_95061 [Ampelomyces quisqualis]|uniref:RRM domain-containing protein n=1 Tax=Ampelomyces quisqualis TaxID=50730 RepID=A0A6A5QAQ8_AMPQU|nr:hypothetical protein BDU57DRAFT_95061 [Ampelomyces quisqualis]
MFLLRRAAVRAISATPSKAFLAKPRLIATFTPSTLRTHKQQWATAFQRRFASDDADKTDAEQAAAADVPENFAQTAEEPPMEEGLTPAQQDAQAEPTNEEETIGTAALEQVAKVADSASSGQTSATPRDETVVPRPQLYIGNLYYEITADQLKKVFSRFGTVVSVKIVYDNRGLSRGFGYVEFEKVEDAQAAVKDLDTQVFEGRNLVVQFNRAKPSRDGGPGSTFGSNEPSKTLFIGNMSFEMSDKDLNDLFRNIRNVMDVRVAIDRRTGQPRGFAHADFTDVASATKAKEILGDKIIYGRQLRIDYSKSSTTRSDGPRRDDRRDNRRDDRGYNKRADSGTSE